MKTITVKDLTVPLEEYAIVSEEASLFEAVLALEKAQEELDRTRYKYLHKAVLVFDKNNKIVGKISHLDVIRALEPKYEGLGDLERLSLAGFSPSFLKSMLDKHGFWDKSLKDICAKGAVIKVKSFMYTLTKGEYIEESAPLAEAIHILVMGHHQSLLVTSKEEIVGVLRLPDVFQEIFQLMKTTCKL